jgi:hypothetical protein
MKAKIQRQSAAQSVKQRSNQQPAGTILQAYKNTTAQLAKDDEEPLQGKFETAQLAVDEEEAVQMKKATAQLAEEDEEPLQGKFETAQLVAFEEEEPAQRPENRTGLPDDLKSGVENLSGYSLNDVKVHYNSAKPAQLQAHAYAHGSDIHVAPGQEKHLPHEAWHVVQQKQGRVKPTMQMKGKVNVNDDAGLEKEADVMGAKAMTSKAGKAQNFLSFPNGSSGQAVVQGYFNTSGFTYAKDMWTKAEERARYLDARLDLRTSAGDAYVGTLKTNLELKGTKAGTTIAGEAYETLQWDQPKGRSNVIGPGGSSGGDLVEYLATKNGGTVSDFGEVKSASSQDSFKSGIANAFAARGQTNIIMYATDDSLLADGTEFLRAGVNYAIFDIKHDNGAHAGKTYTFVATVQLPDQDKVQYLYTYV